MLTIACGIIIAAILLPFVPIVAAVVLIGGAVWALFDSPGLALIPVGAVALVVFVQQLGALIERGIARLKNKPAASD